MNQASVLSIQPATNKRMRLTHRRPRRAIVILEALIAAVLVISMLSVAVPLVIRTVRIWKQTRHHQMAGDELSGQMDRLIAMPADQREPALQTLTVSEPLQHVLHNASLAGEIVTDEDGKRITLSIDWERVGDPAPIELVAWIDPTPQTPPVDSDPDEKTGEGNQ